jgi:nucleotide-binding universal stress UspA family protein
MFRRLLVAFDGSSHARRALTEGIELAQANRGTVTVLTVTPEPSVWAFSGYGTPVSAGAKWPRVLATAGAIGTGLALFGGGWREPFGIAVLLAVAAAA